MKYLLLPIIRVFWVFVAFLYLPILVLFEGALSLWHWDIKYLKDLYIAYTQNFIISDEFETRDGRYYVYKNCWDYIILKKTYKNKQYKKL